MKWTEPEIQGLKAQEAKDLAVEFLKKLEAKDKSPISAGEVQLKELQYALKLKEAEKEDNRSREAHQQRIKELELEIETERAKHAEEAQHADKIRAEHARLLEQVQVAEESLSIQLERATREHNLKIEQLEAEFSAKAEDLKRQIDEMQQRRDALRVEIADLADLREMAGDINELREKIEASRGANQQEIQQLEEESAAAEFEKTKKINQIKREQELEITALETEHKKNVLQANQQAAEEILAGLHMVSVKAEDWEHVQKSATESRQREEQELDEIRRKAEEDVRKKYNITSPEIIDVTDLFYSQQTSSREVESLRGQVEKLDAEIRRMREHIEHEPQRISGAVEAAKVHVQNRIEQGGKR